MINNYAIGVHVWVHSDGRINELLEKFIDMGVDVMELVSPTLVGIDEISSRFRGRIAFESTVDTQTTLVKGSKSEIETEAKNGGHKRVGLLF